MNCKKCGGQMCADLHVTEWECPKCDLHTAELNRPKCSPPFADNFGCVGNAIITASGLYLDFADPKPEQITISDIAQGLSRVCRFASQLPPGKWHSVAGHCVAGAWAIERELGEDGTGIAYAFLLHDAAEAYMGDCPKPLKNLIPEFSVIEDRLQSVIEAKFSVPKCYKSIIKEYDRRLLRTEKEIFFKDDTEHWTGFDGIESVDDDLIPGLPIIAMTKMFLRQYARLSRKLFVGSLE